MRVFAIIALAYALVSFGSLQDSNKMPPHAVVNAQATGANKPSPQVVIKAARLIDGRGGPPLEPAMVLVVGKSPMSAIVSATRLNAEIIGWSDRIGSVEKGKYADLAAVPGNPLKDITLMERVGFVMKGGIVYRSELTK